MSLPRTPKIQRLIPKEQLPTEEEIPEILAFIESFINTGFELSHQMFIENTPTFAKKVMQRGMIRKNHPTLKQQRDEKIIKPLNLKKQAKKQEALERQIGINEHLAENDYKLKESNKLYKIIRKYEKSIVIGIPYDIFEKGKGTVEKYAYSLVIDKSETPELYKKLLFNLNGL